MPHILFVSNSAYNLWHFRRPVWEALLVEGYHITALAPEDGYESDLRSAGIKFVALPALQPHQQSWRQDLALLAVLRRKYRALNPDLILHFTIKPNIYGSIVARWCGIQSVANVTGLGTTRLSGPWVWWRTAQMYRHAFRGVAAVVCQNASDQNNLQAIKARPIRWHLIPGSGVDTDLFRPQNLPEVPPFRFLFVGRILVDKGIGELFDAWRRLHPVLPQAELHVVGSRPEDHPHMLDETQWQAGLALPRLHYHGRVEEVLSLLYQTQVLVLPSYREGLSRALLEAMATARPIITTDVPGCRELVVDQKTGWLVPAQHVDALAQAMQQAFVTPIEQLQAMGKEASRLVEEQYSAARIGSHYLKLVNSLLCQ